jgi:hypothetical protein
VNGSEDYLRTRRQLAVSQETLYAITTRIIENTQRLEERTARSAMRPAFVFKQIAPAAIAVNGNESSDDSRFDALRESPTWRGFPAFDVNQLTDQVIRQIDQRATAWRERLGKI